ncbi:NAD(P)-binding protein [Pseudomonas taiwanensis]|uniref:NAD(P)-binding protein n=1 Tax=Pseudomonas taiwanensis TaxID=470150 RepID=A0ABR6VBX0_9PSED|nr:NAD(P)-binding protein [Pseudomonas taiwanensis]MBC3478024.1 NAD(P)-binding protein [Pseudomonas taiwanensis]
MDTTNAIHEVAQPDLVKVWEPLRIGSTTVKNRIMMTAQTLLYGKDNILGDRHVEYYRERALGGCALFICEQQGAFPIAKGSFHEGCTAWEERCIPQYAKLAEAVHEHGARQFVQLFGAGVHDRGTMIMDEWHPLWAASRVRSITHNEIPLVMESHHFSDVIKGFGISARNVQASGCDGVELHAAHSYFLGQFLSPAYNKRDDKYGGSIAARCRLILEVGEEIRRQVGANFTVGVRISFDEFLGASGITPEQSEEQLEILASSGLFDFFNISAGGYHTLHKTVAPMSTPEGYLLPFGQRAKEIVGNRAKVFIVGRILSLSTAERALRDGMADMVAMTRAQMAEPRLIAKTMLGRSNEIVRCIGANECIARIFENRPAACLINPVAGREWKWGEGKLVKVGEDQKKNIVVVGAGLGGMHLAQICARRGHKVTLLEKQGYLGGRLDLLRQLPARGEWATAIDNLERGLKAHNVDVKLNTNADPDLLSSLNPDCIVLATGARFDVYAASPFRPDRDFIPGCDQENVYDVESALRLALVTPEKLGKKILVLDETGEYLPFGLAELLATVPGVEVEVVSPHNVVGADVQRRLEYQVVVQRLVNLGVTLTPQHNIQSISGRCIELLPNWGGRSRIEEVDSIVLSIARVPNDELYQSLRESFSNLHRIGDCLAPRALSAVMYEAEELGRTI